jgi:hypothetical protein
LIYSGGIDISFKSTFEDIKTELGEPEHKPVICKREQDPFDYTLFHGYQENGVIFEVTD